MNTSVMVSTGTFASVIDAQVRAMFDRHLEEQSSELYYGELGLVDYEPDVPEEKLADMSGPGKGVLTIENQEYGSVSKSKGYPVTLSLRKYTFDLSWTEEDIHWIAKQTSSKRASSLRTAASGAVQALQQNINEDTAKVFYLGFGTTLLSVGKVIIAHYKFLLINGENLRQKAMVTISKLVRQTKNSLMIQLQRLSEETPFYGEATVRTA